VLGVRNDSVFEGMLAVDAKHLNALEEAPQAQCPDAICDSKRISIHRDSDGQVDFLLVFFVRYNESRVVRTCRGKVFKRVGGLKKQVKDEAEIRQLRADKGEVRFETEPVALDYPAAFDQKAIESFAESVRHDKEWDETHPQEDILELMHLGKLDCGEFKPNVACALLFAKDPQLVIPGSRVRFLRFEGEAEGTGERWNAVKDEVIDGTLPTQIEKTASVLSSQLRKFSRLGKGGKFYTSPEYPPVAWHEAIVNACAHRCYGNGLGNRTIFVKMFDDRLEIESPGSFPPNVTPDNIYEVSSPRNPYLMEALRHLKYVKAAHEGTRRMRDTMRELELPDPIFEVRETDAASVRVTMRNNIKQRRMWVDADVAVILGAQIAQRLSSDQKRYLNFMAEHGGISVSDALRISEEIKSWQTAKKSLMALVDMDIVWHDHAGDSVDRDPKARFRLRKSGT
ncbi:MAG TPA: ATP-binding protein, partial [Pirellulaceae bacterium]|nr:ATP-binding protein [Pirellulaceae bacterium]